MFKKKESELKTTQNNVIELQKQVNGKIELLGEHTSSLYTALNEIQDVFDSIRNMPEDDRLKYENLKKIRLFWFDQVEKIEKDYNLAAAKFAGAGAAGVGLGVAVATMGPTVAMGIATTYGVASTGTAIATLSGAAATNAALAWLGGGALTFGGGGMAAGKAFLALAGPAGWAIGGAALVISGVLLLYGKNNKDRLEKVFVAISKRDEKSFRLALVELNERIQRIIDETVKLKVGILRLKGFGTDYRNMSDAQQHEFGSYVNLMNSSTQLLINPILGLQPKYSDQDYKSYYLSEDRQTDISLCIRFREIIVSLANLLYSINLDSKDKTLLWKSLRKNKTFLSTFQMSKDDFTKEVFNAAFDALDCKE